MWKCIAAAAAAAAISAPGAAHAQDVRGAIGVFGGRQALGAEIEVIVWRAGMFVRSEGFPGTTSMHTLGLRVAPYQTADGRLYVAGAVGQVTCSRVAFGGAATGCDGEPHTVLAAGLGLELRAGAWVGLFLDGSVLRATRATPDRGTPDVPGWTFAAGIRLGAFDPLRE